MGLILAVDDLLAGEMDSKIDCYVAALLAMTGLSGGGG
jgi:hypothetical protein